MVSLFLLLLIPGGKSTMDDHSFFLWLVVLNTISSLFSIVVYFYSDREMFNLLGVVGNMLITTGLIGLVWRNELTSRRTRDSFYIPL